MWQPLAHDYFDVLPNTDALVPIEDNFIVKIWVFTHMFMKTC